jgi:hypothetical protein
VAWCGVGVAWCGKRVRKWVWPGHTVPASRLWKGKRMCRPHTPCTQSSDIAAHGSGKRYHATQSPSYQPHAVDSARTMTTFSTQTFCDATKKGRGGTTHKRHSLNKWQGSACPHLMMMSTLPTGSSTSSHFPRINVMTRAGTNQHGRIEAA